MIKGNLTYTLQGSHPRRKTQLILKKAASSVKGSEGCNSCGFRGEGANDRDGGSVSLGKKVFVIYSDIR